MITQNNDMIPMALRVKIFIPPVKHQHEKLFLDMLNDILNLAVQNKTECINGFCADRIAMLDSMQCVG